MYTLDELREKVLQRLEVDDILLLLDIISKLFICT